MKKIIVDSCCDMTPDMKREMELISVPLIMTLGDKDFLDDENLDIAGFINEMKDYSGKASSAFPPPLLYQEAIEATNDAFIVTLSSKLFWPYNNAVMGNNMAMKNGREAAFIFDSKSASAGETLIVIKLHELIRLAKSLIV